MQLFQLCLKKNFHTTDGQWKELKTYWLASKEQKEVLVALQSVKSHSLLRHPHSLKHTLPAMIPEWQSRSSVNCSGCWLLWTDISCVLQVYKTSHVFCLLTEPFL